MKVNDMLFQTSVLAGARSRSIWNLMTMNINRHCVFGLSLRSSISILIHYLISSFAVPANTDLRYCVLSVKCCLMC